MSVRALLIFVCMYLHLFCGSVSSAYLSDGYLENIRGTMRSYNIAKYIDDNYKEKLHLEYKSFDDLRETVAIADKFSKYNNTFKLSDVMSIMINESRLNQFAKNKNDGGTGLGQLTGIKVWWKNELFWVTNPYDKHQNIASIFIVLDTFKTAYGSKYQAVKHYNGSKWKSDLYAKKVLALSKSLSCINNV